MLMSRMICLMVFFLQLSYFFNANTQNIIFNASRISCHFHAVFDGIVGHPNCIIIIIVGTDSKNCWILSLKNIMVLYHYHSEIFDRFFLSSKVLLGPTQKIRQHCIQYHYHSYILTTAEEPQSLKCTWNKTCIYFLSYKSGCKTQTIPRP